MTPDELRALAEDDAKLLEVSCEFVSDLARLCADMGEALDRIWQRRESWYDAMHDDEAGLPSDEAEAAWEIASAALAKMAELEAR